MSCLLHPKIKLRIPVIGFAIALMGCVESFDLPVREADVRFLVVDGFLNTTTGAVNVTLLRATLVTETDLPFESNAVIRLEDYENNGFPVTELDSGRYQGSAPLLDPGKQYRLYIKTADGKEYRSAFITLKPTPEIKEVSWKALPDGTQVTVDTEDSANSTRYYRWTFVETWEYHSRYISYLHNDERPRNRDEMIDVCYHTVPSTHIYTTTTSRLTEDKVNNFELSFLPRGTEKLGYRYSILVQQYAISKETYEYLEKLKKTSQDLNGLYAPQPSKVTGNFSSMADADEVVLGYFDAGEVKEKRIFITPEDLPAHLRTIEEDNTICYLDTLRTGPLGSAYSLIESFVTEDGEKGITYSFAECADCRLKGGVTTKPIFWP